MRHAKTVLLVGLIGGWTVGMASAQDDGNAEAPENQRRSDARAKAEADVGRDAGEEEDRDARAARRGRGRRDREEFQDRRRDEPTERRERGRRDWENPDRRDRDWRRDDEVFDRRRWKGDGPGYDWDREQRRGGDRDDEWRYRRHRGHWWYWAPGGYWTYYRNGRWHRYHPSPQGPAEPGTRHAPHPRFDERYYEDGRGEIERYEEDRDRRYDWPDERPYYDGGRRPRSPRPYFGGRGGRIGTNADPRLRRHLDWP